jgi:hypothetical protein
MSQHTQPAVCTAVDHPSRGGHWPRTISACLLALALVASVAADAQIAVRNQGYMPYSDPPINYRSEELHDPVAKLQQRLDHGTATLQYGPTHGYLQSVLSLLNVPISSQTLVFSKTSFQYPRISPEHPRALYFNDDVYVGSVHDGKAIEVVSFDPMQGAIFYLLDEHQRSKPIFQRAELDCTQCHIAAGTRGIPGVLLRSVYPTTSGTLVPDKNSFITDQESPFSQRWGGWYVTGVLPNGANMANAAVAPTAGASASAAAAAGASGSELTPLQPRFDASSYLSPLSDVVAQLVLAHQTQMHNLITLTNYRTRMALYAHAHRAASGTAGADSALSAYERRLFEQPAEQLLRYLLFSDETPLDGNDGQKIMASSVFAKEFEARGIRDANGRSLRDFDLSRRIFRYPCSYLIYSESFDAMPEPAKSYIYHRLLEVLTAQDQSAPFAKLGVQDRRAILEILLATKGGLPLEWHSYAAAHHIQVLGAAVAGVGVSRASPP